MTLYVLVDHRPTACYLASNAKATFDSVLLEYRLRRSKIHKRVGLSEHVGIIGIRTLDETAEGKRHRKQATAAVHACWAEVQTDTTTVAVPRNPVEVLLEDTSHCCRWAVRCSSCWGVVESKDRLEEEEEDGCS